MQLMNWCYCVCVLMCVHVCVCAYTQLLTAFPSCQVTSISVPNQCWLESLSCSVLCVQNKTAEIAPEHNYKPPLQSSKSLWSPIILLHRLWGMSFGGKILMSGPIPCVLHNPQPWQPTVSVMVKFHQCKGSNGEHVWMSSASSSPHPPISAVSQASGLHSGAGNQWEDNVRTRKVVFCNRKSDLTARRGKLLQKLEGQWRLGWVGVNPKAKQRLGKTATCGHQRGECVTCLPEQQTWVYSEIVLRLKKPKLDKENVVYASNGYTTQP